MSLVAVSFFPSYNHNSSLTPLMPTSLDFKRYAWKYSIKRRQEVALSRGRAPQLSHRFHSWPSISMASSMSTSRPCCTQTGYQREARKEWPYFPGFQFFHQTTYFCIGKTTLVAVEDWCGGGRVLCSVAGTSQATDNRYITLSESVKIVTCLFH